MALSLAACGGSSDTVDITSDNAAAIATALTDADGTLYADVAAAIAAGVSSVDITTDNAAAITGALTGADGTVYADVAAAIAAGVTSVDITSDNAAAITGALTGADGTVYADVAAAVAAGVTSVDITSDNATAATTALRNAAAELGVTGTSIMTDAELITAIKTANDTAIAAGVDLTTDNAAAIDAAVVALGLNGITTLAQLNTAYDALVNPTSFVLTTGVNDGPAFTASSSAGVVFDATTSNSLSNGDVLVGGSGSDTLQASLNGANVNVNISAIETVSITNVTAASTLNMADASDVTLIEITSSTADLTLNNIQAVPTVTINTNAVATNLDFAEVALSGAADTLQINLEGISNPAGAGTGDITISRAAGATADLEQVTLNSTLVANVVEDLDVSDVDTTTLGVIGDQDLTISGTLDTDIATVSAGDFTGDLTLTLSATATTLTSGSGADNVTVGSSDDSVAMGDGNDNVDISAANFASTVTIGGGDGADSITLTDAATVIDADFTNVTSVETLTADADNTQDITLGALADAAGIRTVNAADAVGNDEINVGAGFTSALTVNMAADNLANTVSTDVLASAYTGALTINAAITTTDDHAATLTGGTGTADKLNLLIDESDDAVLTGVSGIESIVLADGNADADHTTAVTLADVNATYTSATDYQTLTVDATAIGASGDTVNISAAAELDAKVVLKGGDGANNITLSASANFGDTVTAAGGDDTITTATDNLTSADIIDGGDGDDTIVTSDDATVVDADFTNVTNVEAISGTATFDLDLTLGALADAAGVRTVTFTDEASTGDVVTIGAGFTSALTVQLDDDASGNTVTATNYVGAGLTVKVDSADATDTGTSNTLTGSAGTDVLEVSITGANTVLAQTNMTNFETVTIVDGTADTNHAATFTLANENATYTNSTTYQTITVDATAIGADGDTVNITAAAETDAKVIINGGAGVNTITLSKSANFGDTIDAGAGDDVIVSALNAGTAYLTADDTVAGGLGDDTLQFDADVTATDAIFANVSSVETVEGKTATVNLNLTLGANADAAGIRTANFSDTGAAETITVSAGFSSNLAIDLDADTNLNTVTASTYTGNLSVTALATDIDGAAKTVLTGGSGTDTLTVTSTGDDIAIIMTGITNFENIVLVDDGDATADTLSVSVGDANVADGATLTIDGSALTTDDITVDLSAEANGLNVVKGGAGVDNITGSASDLGDTLEGNAGDDNFTFATANLTAADTVSGGDGTDELILSDASTVVDADFTNFTSVETISHGNLNMTLTLGELAQAAGVVTVTNGSGTNNTTVGAGYTSDLSIAMAGTDIVNAASYVGNLTVSGDIDLITAADTLTGGSGTGDVLSLSLDSNNDDATAGQLANVSGFETISFSNDDEVDITLHENNVSDGGSVTINAVNITTQVLTLTAANETDGSVTVIAAGSGAHQVTLGNGNDTYTSTSTGNDAVAATGGNNTISTGDGADEITAGTGDDTINGQNGDDVFVFATANLNQNDTINGGAGDDKLRMSNDAVVVDSDFTNVDSVKTLETVGDINLTATLGSAAASAGIDTVTLTDSGAANTVTVGSGFTSSTLSVTISTDATAGDSVVATNYTGSLTVNASDENMDTRATTITGGSGSDTVAITVTADNSIVTSGITGVETITLTGDNGDTDTSTVTTADGLVSEDATLTIDARGMDQAANDAILTFDGSAETDGNFVVLTAGAGAHSVTLGGGDDTYTGTGSGGTTVTATAGINSITTGSGADTITAGSGVDTIAGGTGADEFVFGSAANGTGDTITDFVSADDQISVALDYSSLLSGVVVNANRTGTGVDGGSAAEATLTGQRGEYVYNTSTSELLVNVTADASFSGADYAIGVNAADTAANTIAAGDLNFVVTGTGFADTIVAGGGVDNISAGAGADTITGGGGNDVIDGDTGADTITGGAGDDTISLGGTDGAADIINIAFGGEGTDTINEFEVGNGGDVLDFTGTTDVANVTTAGGYDATTLVDDAGASVEAVAGFSIVDNGDAGTDDAASLSVADIETYLADIGNTTQVVKDAVDAVGYLAVSDGTHTAIIKYSDGNADVTIDAAEISIVAILDGIGDAGTILAGNLADFS